MSEIQDEAYSEAMDEIESLKQKNLLLTQRHSEKLITMRKLADLADRLADALQARTTEGSIFPYDLDPHMLDEPARMLLTDYRKLISEARATIWR